MCAPNWSEITARGKKRKREREANDRRGGLSEGVDGAINAALSERAGESQYQSAVLTPRGAIQTPECNEKRRAGGGKKNTSIISPRGPEPVLF